MKIKEQRHYPDGTMKIIETEVVDLTPDQIAAREAHEARLAARQQPAPK